MATSTVAHKPTLEYVDTVGFGFVADQGGRGFHLPMGMAIRGDGRIYVASRSHAEALRIVGIQIVSSSTRVLRTDRQPWKRRWPDALPLSAGDR